MADIDFFIYKQFEKTFSNAKTFVNKECPYDCDTSGHCPFNICETLVPCAEEAPYIECVYDVVANRDSGGTIVSYPSIHLYYVNPCNAFSMKVDDKPAQTPSNYYTFDSEGEHVVRFYSKNKITTLANEAFKGITRLVTVRHWDDITTFSGIMTFQYSGVKYLTFPPGLKVLPRETFYETTRYEIIILPETIVEIQHMAFRYCRGTRAMYVYSKTPPLITGNNTFNGHFFTFYVPAESLDLYKSASGWSGYKSYIKPI